MLGVLLVLAGGACIGGNSGLRVGLAYGTGGPGDDGFNDSALSGLNRARNDLGAVSSVKALTAGADDSEQDQYQRLTLLCEAGYNPVIAVGFTYAGSDPADGPLARASKDCPKTHFAIVDDETVSRPNVANLVFADQQGSFLVGVAAGSKTTTGTIGFVGGCDIPLINRFLAGYAAGARAVRPDVKVVTGYVSDDPNACDFTNTDAGRRVATGLYAGGADVVFQAAGGSGIGVFEAAKAAGAKAIGVDQDQYNTVGASLRSVILTSMVKRVDNAVYDFIANVSEGRFTPGIRRYDLADNGLTFATSGGFIDNLIPTIEAYREKIISGQIVVPTTP